MAESIDKYIRHVEEMLRDDGAGCSFTRICDNCPFSIDCSK